ncbi:MarR family winged helix-turn-helix transcriptional regulator [Clostridium sp. DL1XJH146]
MKEQSIGQYISSIYRHQSILINNSFQKYGFGCGQYIFLLNIFQNEGINQKNLSENVKIDRANTNRAIKKLEQLGYIYTLEDKEDRRNHKSYLTEEGKNLVPILKKELLNITEIMSTGIFEDKREYLFESLEQINTNVQQCVNKLREEKSNEIK